MIPPTPEEVWRTYDAVEARLTAPISERMLDLAGLRPGMHLLDLATGRGEPAIRAAHRVGPQGSVLGVDLAEPLLQMARERAVREGVANLTLRAGNAEALVDLPVAHFDVATARWGLMYMTAPVAALATVRRALRATGVLVAATWAEPERVPYFTLSRRLLERYRAVPAIDPEAPGTFRFADLARIERDFGEAGFMLEAVEEVEIPVIESESAAGIVAWSRALGLTRLLNDLPEATQRAWEADYVAELERRRTGATFQLTGVTRLIVARPSW